MLQAGWVALSISCAGREESFFANKAKSGDEEKIVNTSCDESYLFFEEVCCHKGGIRKRSDLALSKKN